MSLREVEYNATAVLKWFEDNRPSVVDNDTDAVKQLYYGFAIASIKKQIPMPVRVTTSTKRCGNCNRQLSGCGNIHPERLYCPGCGQAIDWGE